MIQEMLPIFPADTTRINDHLAFCERNGTVYYFNGTMPIFSHPENDLASFRMFTSQLYVNGNCRQVEIVKAFGVSRISVKRSVKKYREQGPSSFFKKSVVRKPRVLTPGVIGEAQEMLAGGKTRRDVVEQLGVKRDTLVKAIRSGRIVETRKPDEKASVKSERSVQDSRAAMGMGCSRVLERVAAATGNLNEAPSVFEPSYDVPNGGVLCALPALLANGLLKNISNHFSLPKGFYSVVQIFLLLGFMSLSRVKNIERLRYVSPGEWGGLIGLDRIPEVKTLRSKLKTIAETGRVVEWSALLSTGWMESESDMAGVLYIDGHVRVYHGSKTKLPKRYVSRERLCLRGMTDYWVNDKTGRPFFVVSTPFTEGLIQNLEKDIVPRLLKDVPDQPDDGELEADPRLCRFVTVFDREGYSPGFFKRMWEQRIACQTYNKYPKDEWPDSEFAEYLIQMPHGNKVKMKLAERDIVLSNKFPAREIRKLTDSGHQVSVLSTDYKSDMTVVALHMFSRWSQENFFKYMIQHFDIDALVCHEKEKADETGKVVNPSHRTVEGQIKKLAGKLGRKKAEFGGIVLEGELKSGEVSEYESKKGELRQDIELLEEDLERLKKKRKKIPKHVTLGELPEEERFVRVSSKRKQLADTIKMVAYRGETAMALILREILERPGDARSLLRGIYATEADLIPNQSDKTLKVRLHHLANQMSDKAVQLLFENLNSTQTVYPGTDLKMIYELVSIPNPPSQEF